MRFFIEYIVPGSSFIFVQNSLFCERSLNPFTAPEPLPILNSSNFVPKNGFPVVKGVDFSPELRNLRKNAVHTPLS